ncbi:hypothetical protein D3OALGA1CA_2463 [Olavius algarvensis associated proteobacterium Delta 3]|nr:hypothetical protein D3OALGA1CA_2463 [Olavius algarvensis associated proteobacterium Delta 3]
MKIGLALGGGGVRGLAHVAVLEALDELDLRPYMIAGTSIGAIVGALYASGIPAKALRAEIEKHIILENDDWRAIIEKREHLWKWVEGFALDFVQGGLISVQGFLEGVLREVKASRFEDLHIPLLVVAADYWKAEEVIFETGELLPAIMASMAVPGVFAPVSFSGRTLVDGGVVNLVPYDLLLERTDFTIAVDVSRLRGPGPGQREIPNALECVFGTFNIMQKAALDERMERRTPDLFVHPEIHDVRMLEFGKIEEVLHQAIPAIEGMKQELQKRLID